MSEDELRIRIVDQANSETFQEFLDEIRRDHPRFCMILDNASYHKSKAVREYVESTRGSIELEFLPPYTPQLNPVETVWRDVCPQVPKTHSSGMSDDPSLSMPQRPAWQSPSVPGLVA